MTEPTESNVRDLIVLQDQLMRLERSNAQLRAENLGLKNSLRESKDTCEALEGQRDRLRTALRESMGDPGASAAELVAARERCTALEREVHSLANRRALKTANQLGRVKRSILARLPV